MTGRPRVLPAPSLAGDTLPGGLAAIQGITLVEEPGGSLTGIETAVANKPGHHRRHRLPDTPGGVALGHPGIGQAFEQVHRGGAAVGKTGDNRLAGVDVAIAGQETCSAVIPADATGFVKSGVLRQQRPVA
jgi:hypothetical protein